MTLISTTSAGLPGRLVWVASPSAESEAGGRLVNVVLFTEMSLTAVLMPLQEGTATEI